MISPKWAMGISPAPRPNEGQGKRLERGGLVPSFFLWDFDGIICLPEGHRDPRTHCVQGLFVWEGGAFFAPSQALFHTHVFCSRPRFFLFNGLRGPVGLLVAR